MTQHPGWDLPIYEEFFRAVREVNASLPADRQLRVLLGDPPIAAVDGMVVADRVGCCCASAAAMMAVTPMLFRLVVPADPPWRLGSS